MTDLGQLPLKSKKIKDFSNLRIHVQRKEIIFDGNQCNQGGSMLHMILQLQTVPKKISNLSPIENRIKAA